MAISTVFTFSHYRSATCPQCRADCRPGQQKNLYFDFGPDEQEMDNAKKQREDSEDTIRQLMQRYDVDKRHQLDDIEAHDEELAILRSQVDDNNENCNMLCDTIDQLNAKVAELERSLAQERTKLETINIQISRKEQDVYYLQNELHLSKTNLDISNNTRCRVEEDLRKLKWTSLQNEHMIVELQESNESNESEIKKLKIDLNRLGRKLDDTKFINAGLNIFIKEFFPNTNFMIQRMMRKIRTTFKSNDDVTDSNGNQLMPYCGDIYSWNIISIPNI